MKSVYLRYTSSHNEHLLTDEDYDNAIRPLVLKLRRCKGCGEYFDPDNNPCAGEKICMTCLLAKHPGYRFLEIKAVDKDGEKTYAFIDENGKVYTSRENYSTDLSEDITYTLSQNGFSYPLEHTPFKATEPVKLWTSKFSVYGDVRNSVVVLNYNDFHEKQHFTWLLYKGAAYKELTKRGEGKVLHEKAVAMIERSKRGSHYYIDGEQRSQIWDSDIYQTIAKMEAMMYDLSLQFAPPLLSENTEATVVGTINSEDVAPDETADTGTGKRQRGRLALVKPDEETHEQSEPKVAETTD